MSVLTGDGPDQVLRAACRRCRDVELEVDEHEVLGIIGPNGAGKTTLFSCIVRSARRRRTAGCVFDGQDMTGWPADKMARAGLVRTFQLMRPFESMTVLDNVAVAAHCATTDPGARPATPRARGHRAGAARALRQDARPAACRQPG